MDTWSSDMADLWAAESNPQFCPQTSQISTDQDYFAYWLFPMFILISLFHSSFFFPTSSFLQFRSTSGLEVFLRVFSQGSVGQNPVGGIEF